MRYFGLIGERLDYSFSKGYFGKKFIKDAILDCQYELYEIPKNERRLYTIDHFIPLSIGGDNDVRNLWPELIAIKNLRFNLEWELYDRLQQGQITQKYAVQYVMRAKMNPPPLRRRH